MKRNQTTWKSKHHSFKAVYSDPWELISKSSSKGETLFGLIDKSNGTSYMVKITNDVSKELLPDDDYYEAVKMQMLGAHPENSLINEATIQFHGEDFQRQVFVMHTAKWGTLTQHAYTRRTGTVLYSVQISFPSQNNAPGSLFLTQKLVDLNDQIEIEGK